MSTTLRIPRQTDTQLIRAISAIKAGIQELPDMTLEVTVEHLGTLQLNTDSPEATPQIQRLLALSSCAIKDFHIKRLGSSVLQINRQVSTWYDNATCQPAEHWLRDNTDGATRAFLCGLVLAQARTHLKASDLESTLQTVEGTAWENTRNVQATTLSSLQNTLQSLMLQASQKSQEMDSARRSQYEKLEEELRQRIKSEKDEQDLQYSMRLKDLENRASELANKEKEFETKEASYVSRTRQREQIDNVKTFLNNPDLSKQARSKRWPVHAVCAVAFVITAGLTFYATINNYAFINDAQKKSLPIGWWEWTVLAIKSALPFTVCISFLVYWLRWVSSWARQNADEELRNRVLLMDVARSSWLLEAVRDSHKQGKDIPIEFLKDLSKNLFTKPSAIDSDSQPMSASDLAMRGLSSLRIKSPDGAEVEAKRGK